MTAAGKPGITSEPNQAQRVLLRGRVQGVGFRPFVYRLAHALELRGWVRNTTGQVEIQLEGSAERIAEFARRVIEDAPPLAVPELIGASEAPSEGCSNFEILRSGGGDEADVAVPPDHFMCADCLAELNNPSDRRFRYPFLNCTQCGPRWTIILNLPYDRPQTTLKDFTLCPDCLAEYREPMDRRFHAEPVACPACGPQLSYHEPLAGRQLHREAALQATVADLRAGRIVAVKGVGGYHLMCDAACEPAVQTLRARKHRPGKPLAVMFPANGADGLQTVRQYLEPGPEEARALVSPERPIVLVPRRADLGLAPGVAPELAEIGAFLPYSPLHQLLLQEFERPLVATSGNISGEPVITDVDDAEQRLNRLADTFLHHDRPIVRPADDSVVRRIAGRVRPLRIGRGMAPAELGLPFEAPPMLAVGGHMKNTVALGFRQRAVVSPHIGEMDTVRSLEVFSRVLADLPRLYQVEPRYLVCDAHPSYASSRWARRQGRPLVEVFHHHAHAGAVWAEAGPQHTGAEGEPLLVMTWDGVGFGEDETLWGGEALLGRPGAWRRVGSLLPFRLPGGERAGRQPWRSAAGMAWTAGLDWQPPGLPDAERALVRHAFARGLNAPVTTAVGRLFDAASCLVLGIERSSYEAEGPMQLEALATGQAPLAGPRLPLLEDAGREVLAIDWRPLLPWLMDSRRSPAQRAMGLHASLAGALAELAGQLGAVHDVRRVGLTGGVFQNRLLCELAIDALRRRGLQPVLAEQMPCNDAAIAFGQLVEAAAQLSGPPP